MLMKRFRPMPDPSTRQTSEQHSPTLERAGKYIFWLVVVAVLVGRAVYLPTNQPVVASDQNETQQAKTEIAQ
jgi:hypothetical protein